MVEVERIRKHVDDPAFLERIFTERERDECLRRTKPEECLAARWAAKEATAKAFGTGIGKWLAFRDVEVLTTPGKGPCIHIHGYFARFPVLSKLSLTHTATTGAAVVMLFPAEGKSGAPDELPET
jgi:holo-[acyl-carrier protein] synthase